MEIALSKKSYSNNLWLIIIPLIVFSVLGVIVAIERAGIALDPKLQNQTVSFLPSGFMIPRSEHNPEKRCLVICNSSERDTYPDVENITFVLDQMSIGFTLTDINRSSYLPPLGEYKTVIIACTELDSIILSIERIFNWVKAGGGLLFAQTPEYEVLTNYFYKELGIERGETILIPQVDAHLITDLMPGGKDTVIEWSDKEFAFDYRMGGNFRLDRECIVHMTGSGPQGPSPMLWENRVGRGRIVVNNNDAMGEKWSRGLVAAAYSLTEPAVAYPVINASVIFIDDFPSPTPEGFDPYIKKDYGVMTEYFYTHIWFPDMLRLAQKHKVKYSGIIIESYNDQVNPTFEPEPLFITERMKYFGTLFLNEGYEIGLHGYNHQSLVLPDFDYGDELPYNKWPAEENMISALRECVRYQEELFPGNIMKTYVPPSNVLSKEGRAVLKNNFPDINLISGLLIDDIFGLEDDFGMGEDGLINLPRISSGFSPIDDQDEKPFWAMLSEISMHFVNSHFIHPDDPMDPDRGAELGWEALSKGFDTYLTWLKKIPMRQMTSQEAGAAVQRFDNLTLKTTLAPLEIVLDLEGFYDEAWLLVRINDGIPQKTLGGALTHVSDNLYLLKAESSHVEIELYQE